MSEPAARRPIKTRNTSFAQNGARLLSNAGFSPNFVSVMSVLFASAGAACIYFAGTNPGPWWLWLGAMAGIQLRLLCNLFDGMIAVEGGKGSPNGDLYNEVPDRLSDVILFAAAGYACATQPLGAAIGWLAGTGSLLTACIRMHGASLTQGHDFSGPMGKAQRMFLLTLLCAAMPFQADFDLLLYGLCGIAGLTLVTSIRRLVRLSRKLIDHGG